ncbi:MAG: glycosyltransferase family 4 protein [Anaerohalosphaeraceae bacterium]|nr:glycosyltransferase family 4 protein [Anaerohalosphaeraceae bacterium]
MKILYIHQYFATPNGKTGTRSYEFAKRWVKVGHNITMLTTTAQLTDEEISHSTGRVIKRFNIDGINVCAFNLPYNQRMSVIKRSLSFMGFFVLATFFLLFTKRPDVVYATSTPLTVGVPCLFGKWFKRIPFVFEVRDQWPEIPIALGYIKNGFLKKTLLFLERRIYLSSSAIIALSPGMAEGIDEVLANKDKKIIIVPNCSDTDVFNPEMDGEHVRKQYGWNEKVVFLHAGAMGKVNSLSFVIDAAEKLRHNKELLFVLLGDGNEKVSLKKRVVELNLDNVQILPSVPKYKLPKFFAATDVGLVVIGNYPIIQHNSANKFFDFLAAGIPVLLNYSGWQREILEKANAGLGCELCDLDGFVANVLKLSRDSQLCKIMGNNSRQIAETQFDRKALAEKVRKILEIVI